MQKNTIERRINDIVDMQLTYQLKAVLRPVGLRRFKMFADWLKSLLEYDKSEETFDLESVAEYLSLDAETQALYDELISELERLTETVKKLGAQRKDKIYDNIQQQVFGRKPNG